MGSNISPLGWALILLIIVLTISLYIGLFIRLKKKPEKPMWISSMQEAGKTLKDPFRLENARMEKLATSVEQFKNHGKSENDETGNAESGDLS
jgi:hypothetical protein